MQWFKRQNTFTKLILGYGLMAILVGFVGYQGNRALGVVRDIGIQLHDKHAIPLARLQAANTSLKEMDRMTRNVILDTTFKNPEAVSRWVAGYEHFHTQFERDFAAYKNAFGAGEGGAGPSRWKSWPDSFTRISSGSSPRRWEVIPKRPTSNSLKAVLSEPQSIENSMSCSIGISTTCRAAAMNLPVFTGQRT